MPEEDVVLTELTEADAAGASPDAPPRDHLVLDDIRNVRFRITADLGQAVLKVREILALRVGSIVTLNRMAGELTDIRVNGLPLARGEVVVINDALHVRMSEILDSSDSLEIDNV